MTQSRASFRIPFETNDCPMLIPRRCGVGQGMRGVAPRGPTDFWCAPPRSFPTTLEPGVPITGASSPRWKADAGGHIAMNRRCAPLWTSNLLSPSACSLNMTSIFSDRPSRVSGRWTGRHVFLNYWTPSAMRSANAPLRQLSKIASGSSCEETGHHARPDAQGKHLLPPS